MDKISKITSIQEALLAEMTKAVRIVMASNGVDKQSNLIKVEYQLNNNAFQLIANDYFVYRSEGRRAGARKVPIKDLLGWIKRYNITPSNGQTKNQLAFAIQTSIYKSGIRGLKYMTPVEEVSTDIASEGIAETLSEVIAEAMFQAIEN